MDFMLLTNKNQLSMMEEQIKKNLKRDFYSINFTYDLGILSQRQPPHSVL